jgi:uncharacterized protein YegP (UPF0339 family)
MAESETPCPRFEIRLSRNKLLQKRWRVVLIAENCEPLNVSENLTSEDAAHTNIAAVKAVAPDAPTILA